MGVRGRKKDFNFKWRDDLWLDSEWSEEKMRNRRVGTWNKRDREKQKVINLKFRVFRRDSLNC